jgi:hypothetical protein
LNNLAWTENMNPFGDDSDESLGMDWEKMLNLKTRTMMNPFGDE